MKVIAFQQEIVRFSWGRCNLKIFIFCKDRDMCLHLHVNSFFMLLPDKAVLLFIQCILNLIDSNKHVILAFMLFFQFIQKIKHTFSFLL